MSKRRTNQTGALRLYGTVTSPLGLNRRDIAEAVRRYHTVRESAPAATVERTAVCEATVGGAKATKPGRMLIRLITAGWSLNGNLYPAAVLKTAAKERAWAKGCQAFVDHASDEEERAHPSGSVKNLAGVLTEDARWDEETQSLVAEVRLFEPWRTTLSDMAEHIGMSIRAWVTGEHGEHGGREGFIVDRIEAGRSVDFVTVPAAGGAIISVLEAVGTPARPVGEARNLGSWLESRLHLALTTYADEMYGDGRLTRDERIVLSAAIGEGLQAWTTHVEANAPQLFQRDLWDYPDTAAATTEAARVTAGVSGEEFPVAEPEGEAAQDTQPAATAATEDVTDGAPPTAPNPPSQEEPVSGTQTGAPPEQAGTATVPDNGQPPTPTTPPPAPAPAPQPSAEAMAATVQAMLAEAMRPLTEQLAAVTARDAAREAENRALRNRQTAAEAVTTALRATEHADVAASISTRVNTRVLAAVPTTAEGAVDDTALAEAITAAIADEATHVRRERANALAEAGVGLPYGVGGAPVQETAGDDGFGDEMKNFFTNTLGMTEAQASIAAKGRG